jgi:catechol 2,3-dioxygenase-like lactoylglutathione lyase family enzyme
MEIVNRHVESVIQDYVERYLRTNGAATTVRDVLEASGIGLRPVLDHCSIMTRDVQERALEFEALGFSYDDRLGVIERDTWWGKVYRKPGYPAMYLIQDYDDDRSRLSPIPGWVDRHTDAQLHHIAISVDQIEHAVAKLAPLGVVFQGEIAGDPGSEFRQIYTDPEIVDGVAGSVLELVERRWGYMGFLAPMGISPSASRSAE